MSSRPPWSLTGAIGAAFSERRIYIRTEGKTRFLTIRPAAQIGGAVAIAALLGWTGYATSAFVANAMDGRSVRIQLETMDEAYKAQLAAYGTEQRRIEEELNQANRRRDEVTALLSAKQANLVDTANGLQEAAAELSALRKQSETLHIARRDDAAHIDALAEKLSAMRSELAGAKTSKANLDGALQTLGSAMDQVIAERDLTSGEMIRLDSEVARLSGAIMQMEDRQERLLSQLEVAARTGLAGLETLFGRSSINLDRILAQARRDYTGSGGPFDPVIDEPEDIDDRSAFEGDTRVATLMGDLETVNLMRFAAERLPFGEPVLGGRRTSGFGQRRDPKGRGWAMHSGIDIAAPRGTRVYATAEGVVTFAGRQRGYGIVVKIRHAFGFETFYAHNSRARVKVGQRVSRGDRVADVGSTGRSTGNHVHYEIRIDNAPVNPIKFIEAARDVL